MLSLGKKFALYPELSGVAIHEFQAGKQYLSIFLFEKDPSDCHGGEWVEDLQQAGK